MGLRDLVILLAVYGSIPFSLKKPFFGVLVWIWLSLMNPHRISWELTNANLAQVAAVVMLVSILISRSEEKKIPWSTITILLAWWWVWIFVTTVFSINPDGAWGQWDTVWKTMLTTFVVIMLLNTKERVITAAIVMMLSVGFYGFKGGFFTIITGGGYRVWGPPATFLSGNNEVGLALLMTLPLLFFVRSILTSKLFALAASVGIFLCFAAILGTQSRGAFVGILAMGMLLVWRSPNRSRFFMLLLLAIPFVLLFMPETWWERMESIKDYRSDPSALGRINAWWMAYYLALDNPITGGGLSTFTRYAFLLYAPEPERVHDAHSIYFEVLGEQGFVGLLIFLLLGVATLVKAGQIRRLTATRPELRWAYDLVTMTQLSVLGYAVSGLFLGLAYFDYYYMLLGLIVGTGVVVQRYLEQNPSVAQAGEKAAGARFHSASKLPVGQAASDLASARAAPPPRSYRSWTFKAYVSFGRNWWAKL